MHICYFSETAVVVFLPPSLQSLLKTCSMFCGGVVGCQVTQVVDRGQASALRNVTGVYSTHHGECPSFQMAFEFGPRFTEERVYPQIK